LKPPTLQRAVPEQDVGCRIFVAIACLARRPFHIDAWVMSPVHLHCQRKRPMGDADFSGRMRDIKVGFTGRIEWNAERTIETWQQ
jgi:hypothetical protein